MERTQEIIAYLNAGATWRGDGKPYVRWKIYNDTVYIAKDMDMPPKIDDDTADYWSIYHKSVVLTSTTATTPITPNLCMLALEGEIRQVWLWAGDFAGFAEWTRNGPSGLIQTMSNNVPNCGVSLMTMGYNYERGLGEALEDHMHAFEDFFGRKFPNLFKHRSYHPGEDSDWCQQEPDACREWREKNSELSQWCNENPGECLDDLEVHYHSSEARFGYTDGARDADDIAQCGWAHIPPNITFQARKDLFPNWRYIYDYTGAVESSCTSWTLAGPGEPEVVSGATWGSTKEGFFRWWMQSIPPEWWAEFFAPPEFQVSITSVEQACGDLTDDREGFRRGFECGKLLLRDTLSHMDVQVSPDDPPMPGMLFSTPSSLLRPNSVWHAIEVPAAHSTSQLSASLAVSHTVLSGTLRAQWVTDAWVGGQFTDLSIPHAVVYDDDDMLIASGAVQARPIPPPAPAGGVGGGPALALAMGDLLHYTIEGPGSVSFYAPATEGLGAAGTWRTYTAQMQSDDNSVYGIGLRDAVVTVDGQDYTGTLVLVTQDPTTLRGLGHTLAPNLASTVTLALTDTLVHLSPGQLVSGALPPASDAANGLILSGFSGLVRIAERDADTDLVSLEGDFARSLALSLAPSRSVSSDGNPVAFTAQIHSNLTDTYRLAVDPPDNWRVEARVCSPQSTFCVPHSVLVTATPGLGAQPGDYAIPVGAVSYSDSTLFSSAVHTVTVFPWHGMQMTVTPDLWTTVPWGAADPIAPLGSINNGQAQIQGAAYTVDVTNTSSTSHTFSISIFSPHLPSEWLILGTRRAATTTITLPPGGVGRLGMYIAPEHLDSLPPGGTSYPFTIHAAMADNPALSKSVESTFWMPSVLFARVTVQPGAVYATPGGTATFDAIVSNAGNFTGPLWLSVTLPIITWTLNSDFQSVLYLAPGESLTQAVTVGTASGEIGQDYSIAVWNVSEGYFPRDYVVVRMVGPCVAQTDKAARAAGALSFGHEGQALSIALYNLTYQLDNLERHPGDPTWRGRVIEAVRRIAAPRSELQLANVEYPTAELEALMTDLFDNVTAADDTAAVAAFCAPMAGLADYLERLAARDVALSATPGAQVTLPGQPTTYTVALSSRGSVTTTYDLDVSYHPEPAEGRFTFYVSHFTLAPGASATTTLVVTPATTGVFPFTVAATAQEDPLIRREQAGLLRAVEALFELVGVEADPPWVEPGGNAATLYATIANVANVPLPLVADVQVLAQDGATLYTNTVPITLSPAIAPIRHALGSAGAGLWPTGTYTVAVSLPSPSFVPFVSPGAGGEGVLGVGQTLRASHGVRPALVPPGDVTVTTSITTEISNNKYQISNLESQVLMNDQRRMTKDQRVTRNSPLTIDNLQSTINNSSSFRPSGLASPLFQSTSGIVRHEEDTLIYSSGWSDSSVSYASGGKTKRSSTVNSTASLSFEGEWVGVGFATQPGGWSANVFVDGIYLGSVDTHSPFYDVTSRYYSLPSGPHTLVISVTGSGFDYVYLDYVDTWDGAQMPSGTFQESDARVYSSGWEPVGGTYGQHYRDGAHAWFPFTGESATYQAVAYDQGGQVRVYLDGAYRGTLDLYSAATVTRTFSFGGLPPGPHVLQISTYRGWGTLDAFATPGSPPFYQAPAHSGIARYEEDDPALRYDGVPLTQTATTWSVGAVGRLSGGYGAWSSAKGDAVSLGFDGTWVGVGLMTRPNAGKAEVFVDGVSRGLVDGYSRSEGVTSVYYAGLAAGTHTISVSVPYTRNTRSSGYAVYLDYIDTWDGSELPAGAFEEDDGRLFRSADWGRRSSSAASGGSYVLYGTNAWFPFSVPAGGGGDSVSVHLMASADGDKMGLYLDGRYLADAPLYATGLVSRSFHFGGLTPGPHVLQVSARRGTARLDAFSVPAVAAPPALVIRRLEEDHSDLHYNGAPLAQAPATWAEQVHNTASGGYVARSSTAGDRLSLAFEMGWVMAGFHTGPGGGAAEVRLDGAAREVVNLYAPVEGVLERVYTAAVSSPHTLEVVVAGGGAVELDFIDTWAGEQTPAGRSEAENVQLVHTGRWWPAAASPKASLGSYLVAANPAPAETAANLWFGFSLSEEAGHDSLTYLALTDPAPGPTEVFIDGASRGTVDLAYPLGRLLRAFSYTGLGPGPHVLRLAGSNRTTADAFDMPATPLADFPAIEWYDTAPAFSDPQEGGVLSTAAAGDLDGGGVVEVVVASQNGHLYVYRGDGVDTGGGSPLLWSAFVGLEADGPALANLDGQAGAEIVVGSKEGVYAFHADGSPYWFTDTIWSMWKAPPWGVHYPQGGAAIGNLDGEAGPEIVLTGMYTGSLDFELFVLEADGRIAWRYPLARNTWFSPWYATPPVLADLSGDGRLDILVAQRNTLYLFDYAHDTLAWTRSVTASLGVYGAPAVADVDGDGGPEIAMAWDGLVELLDADGSLVWSYPTGGIQPGSVAIADVDGDGQLEVVVSMKVDNGPDHLDGRVFVLNADGSLLWSALAEDEASGSGVSVHDLDGDGTWEVIWNGADQGLTIFRGSDGAVLFNEPGIDSGTILDYPIVADVDGDGHAEIVAGDHEGIYVVGCDAAWGPARPVWN
ncbi:MAG: VCBS repeat-containing protein, partial [Thermoflexales bacterium]|nr:VCBS repeat-containing protein [Thermoflexales bacterium]